VNVGDLVRPRVSDSGTPLVEEDWIGVIIGFEECGEMEWTDRYAIVCWSNEYPKEQEYPEMLEVISGCG
jgi:hypothetical protein